MSFGPLSSDKERPYLVRYDGKQTTTTTKKRIIRSMGMESLYSYTCSCEIHERVNLDKIAVSFSGNTVIIPLNFY